MRDLRPVVLYRLYDKNQVLLYVGITVTFEARMKTHRRQKPWFSEVCAIEVEEFTTRDQAMRAEQDAIVTESPRYNLSGASDRDRNLHSVLASLGETREEAVLRLRRQGLTWDQVGAALGISRGAAMSTGWDLIHQGEIPRLRSGSSQHKSGQ